MLIEGCGEPIPSGEIAKHEAEVVAKLLFVQV